MNKIIFVLLVFIIAGCQEYNSNSFDKNFFKKSRIDTSTLKGLQLSKAYEVLDKNCMSCHTSYHNSWVDHISNEKWVKTGLIEPGNAYLSPLILKCKNMGGNMPKDNPEISEEDFQHIIKWIDNI